MGTMVSVKASLALGFAATYVALLVLLGIVLTFRVIAVRKSAQIGIGDGGDKLLQRRIRVHGNFSETAPFLCACLILLPLLGAPEWLVHVVGVSGLTGRILHAIGLGGSIGISFGRGAGMILTIGALVTSALSLLVLAWR